MTQPRRARSRAPASLPKVDAESPPDLRLITGGPTDHAPETPDALHAWIAEHLDAHIARSPVVDGHAAPFDYLSHAYFEGDVPGPRAPDPPGFLGGSVPDAASAQAPPSAPLSPDCVVWAARGSGKTFLGALATLLDLVFKPGIEVRILGGSLEQSQRMHEHLRRLLDFPAVRHLVDGRPTARRIRLTNGSCAEVLAASQTSVRGTRVQKLRCDEVDLFDPEVWAAAQLTTRSLTLARPGPRGRLVRGSVEAFSTMHRPYGLMWSLILGRSNDQHPDGKDHTDTSRAGRFPLRLLAPNRTVFRWGVLDVLEHCGPEHACSACPLHADCQGRAKLDRPIPPPGHLAVADAVAMQSRVDRSTWSAEMLCQRPRRTESVYPEFDPAVHVYSDDAGPGIALPPGSPRRFVAGMDFGYRDETVLLLASVDEAGVLRIEREHAAPALTLDQHIGVLRAWLESGHASGGLGFLGVDPAGRQVNHQTGRSNITCLREAGFTVRSRSSLVTDGVRLVRTRLGPAGWAGGINGSPGPSANQPVPPPRLFVHARCTHLIEALERYHYPPGRPDCLEPVKDGPDHACDALRYLILNLDRPRTTTVEDY